MGCANKSYVEGLFSGFLLSINLIIPYNSEEYIDGILFIKPLLTDLYKAYKLSPWNGTVNVAISYVTQPKENISHL